MKTTSTGLFATLALAALPVQAEDVTSFRTCAWRFRSEVLLR